MGDQATRRHVLQILCAGVASLVLPATSTPAYAVGDHATFAFVWDGIRLLQLVKIVDVARQADGAWRYRIEIDPAAGAWDIPEELWTRMVGEGNAVVFEADEDWVFFSRPGGT